MSMNSFGHLYRFTTWGESHGKAIGVTIDGCPPRIDLTEKKIQNFLDKRKPGQNKFTLKEKDRIMLKFCQVFLKVRLLVLQYN